jgi:hypothetical protein
MPPLAFRHKGVYALSVGINDKPRKPEMKTEIEIAEELFTAKIEEKKATEKRVALEEELIALLGSREEGSQTHQVGAFKITITGKLNRKIDWDIFDAKIATKIPESLHPVKMKRELDDAGVKYLSNNEPQFYKILSTALTVKPAKTAVTIVQGV